jgi:hypothetical protein
MPVTWNNRIKAMFDNSYWVLHMRQVSGGHIDLSSYQSVQASALTIYDRISSKTMPPGEPLPDQDIADFKTWMGDGYPEGNPADRAGTTPAGGPVTWDNTIKAMLSGFAGHMLQISGGNLDLADYQSVKAHAQQIYSRLLPSAGPGRMPPGPPYLSDLQIQDFLRWMEAGAPQS